MAAPLPFPSPSLTDLLWTLQSTGCSGDWDKVPVSLKSYLKVFQRLKVRVLVTQLCLTLCDPMDYIAQQALLLWNSPARTLE